MTANRVASNRHPVDRLADLRQQIKELQAEADALRDGIIAGRDFLGAENVAQIKMQEQKRLDRAKLEAAFGKDAVQRCCTPKKLEALYIVPFSRRGTVLD